MKMFLELLDYAEEELEDAKDYYLKYKLYKESYPMVSDMFRSLAQAELGHANRFREACNEYLREHKNERMEDIMDVMGERLLEDMEDLKSMIR